MRQNKKIVGIAANSMLSACVSIDTTIDRLKRIKNPPQKVCDFICNAQLILGNARVELKDMRDFLLHENQPAEQNGEVETDIEKEVERKR